MDLINQLAAWLEQPVYGEGVVLYERLIGPGFMLSMLKTGDDDYNRQKLTLALTEKHEQLVAEQQARQASYPEPLTASLQDAGILMDERTVLKERMRNQLNSGVYESPELKDWAFRILEIRDQLGVIYGRKDFFDQHGYMPEVASIDAEQTPADLLKRRNTLRTYITRYQNKLRTILTAEQQEKPVQLLEQYRKELYQVEQQLSAINGQGDSVTSLNDVSFHD
ncbi:hypothetical protein [Spirosoma fluminis]